MTLNCKNVEMTLSQMIDGEVSKESALAMSKHVNECSYCADLYKKMLEVNLQIQALQPPVVSRDFESSLTSKLSRPQFGFGSFKPSQKFGALAAGLVVLLVTIYVSRLPFEQTTPLIENPNPRLSLDFTPCENAESCGIQGFCTDGNDCSVNHDPVSQWLTGDY